MFRALNLDEDINDTLSYSMLGLIVTDAEIGCNDSSILSKLNIKTLKNACNIVCIIVSHQFTITVENDTTMGYHCSTSVKKMVDLCGFIVSHFQMIKKFLMTC